MLSSLIQHSKLFFVTSSTRHEKYLICSTTPHTRGYDEKADSAAKDGLSLSVTAPKSPASELLPHVAKLIFEKWQKSWNKINVPAINFSHLIPQSVFISTSDLYHVCFCCCRALINLIVRLVIAH